MVGGQVGGWGGGGGWLKMGREGQGLGWSEYKLLSVLYRYLIVILIVIREVFLCGCGCVLN